MSVKKRFIVESESGKHSYILGNITEGISFGYIIRHLTKLVKSKDPEMKENKFWLSYQEAIDGKWTTKYKEDLIL